jgi:hypothetical protein
MRATVLAAVGAATISLAGCATVTAEPNLTPSPIATSQSPSSLDELIAKQLVVDELPTRPGYDRDCGKRDACSFGPAWTDDFDGKYSRTGCDQRNETLSIQLRDVVFKPGTRNCKVLSGVLDPDPYTGRTIPFSSENPSAIQVDHVFAIHRSWDAGAADWTLAQRKTFANDVDDNLLAVDGRANQSKGDKGLEWLPTAAFACTYATKYLTVAAKYQLLVTTNDITTASAACASTEQHPK